MAIEYQIENQDTFLHVVAKGQDDSLDEVLAYFGAIVEASLQHESHKILCDEREVAYTISVFDTFQLAETASKYAPKLVKVAIVCDPRYLESGKFYETVASNRGLSVLVTSNYTEAVEWLK
jgi:hypothetical protein